ncbi:MAG TPA: hypothetical protein VGM69_15350 [Chloroflexota bacterium]|jgi:hypothetical protein
MADGPVAARVQLLQRAVAPFFEAVVRGPAGRMPRDRPVADFLAGNPQEDVLPVFAAAIHDAAADRRAGPE